MEYSGAGGDDENEMKKTRSKKSRDTVPLSLSFSTLISWSQEMYIVKFFLNLTKNREIGIRPSTEWKKW